WTLSGDDREHHRDRRRDQAGIEGECHCNLHRVGAAGKSRAFMLGPSLGLALRPIQLPPHACAVRVVDRGALAARTAPLTDDLDPDPVRRTGATRRDVAERERALRAVTVAAGSYPAHHPALVPDRLITDGVGITRIDREREQAQSAARGLLLDRRRAADEIALVEIDEASEARLVRPIDGAILARPCTEALLDAHGVQRTAAEELQTLLAPGSAQQII